MLNFRLINLTTPSVLHYIYEDCLNTNKLNINNLLFNVKKY